MEVCRVNVSGPEEEGLVVGSFEHVNEASCSIEGGEYLN
jgi:hypothetical protein